MAEATSRPARDAAAGDDDEDPRAEVAIMWFRRDLRVDDNPALAAAQKFAKHVVSWRRKRGGGGRNGGRGSLSSPVLRPAAPPPKSPDARAHDTYRALSS
jgi:hypothetical protein